MESIKYFAVSKGIINGVVQNWRTVFHPGNKLNKCVWTPLFILPSLNSLLRIVDERTVMVNRDMGEMFLNFNLHTETVPFACINIGPLDPGRMSASLDVLDLQPYGLQSVTL